MVKPMHLLLVFGLCTGLAWAGVRLEPARDVTFTPVHFYLGDEVTLNFWLPANAEEHLDAGLYPQHPNLLIEEIIILQGQQRAYVSVRFRSFVVGSQRIAFHFGDIETYGVDIYTRSLVDEGYDQPRTVYAPKLLQGTQLFIIIATAILVFSVPSLLFTIQQIKRLYFFYKNRKFLPYKVLIKSLTQLIRGESQLSDVQYYSQLSMMLRTYLSRQLHVNSLTSATASEMSLLLNAYFDESILTELVQFFQRSDAIRFGGRFSEPHERDQDTNFILSIAKMSEKWQVGASER